MQPVKISAQPAVRIAGRTMALRMSSPSFPARPGPGFSIVERTGRGRIEMYRTGEGGSMAKKTGRTNFAVRPVEEFEFHPRFRDYFAAAYRLATSSQFTTFQNAVM
jgi:hypothetical protein